jgi:pimeloyl-ACP methyl ester carboxylesterase
MKHPVLCCALLLSISQPDTAQNERNTTPPVTPPGLPELVRVEARPEAGFFYAYYLFVPSELRGHARPGVMHTLLVLPNNTGKGDDDLVVHEAAAKHLAEQSASLASTLKTAMLVPAFPRPRTEWRFYTHALNRNSMLTERRDLKRFDLELISMIDDARARLRAEGLIFDQRVFMFGFSASGAFTNRFTMIHPDRLKAAAFGSPGGWAMAPISRWKGKPLRYPIGTADFEAVTGKKLDLDSLRRVPLFRFMGSVDTNDSVVFRDSFDKEDEELIFDLFGKTLIERWPATQAIYSATLPAAKLKLYPGVGHSITEEMWHDVTEFFAQHLLD